ncbi:MAG: hypothetical protein KGI54_18720, partial [Pseudomonadota bacterium]|nr:hypothetical protein [Pseudomonadota bacterium]
FIKQFEPEASKYYGRRFWAASCPTPVRCKDGKYKMVFIVAEACLRPISGPSIVEHVRLWDELPSKVNA